MKGRSERAPAVPLGPYREAPARAPTSEGACDVGIAGALAGSLAALALLCVTRLVVDGVRGSWTFETCIALFLAAFFTRASIGAAWRWWRLRSLP